MKVYLQNKDMIKKSAVTMGGFVITSNDEDVIVGRVEHIMTEGILGIEGSEYSIEASTDSPAVLIRKFEQEEENGMWEETEWLIGKPMSMCSAIQALPIEEETMSKGYWTGIFDPKGLV